MQKAHLKTDLVLEAEVGVQFDVTAGVGEVDGDVPLFLSLGESRVVDDAVTLAVTHREVLLSHLLVVLVFTVQVVVDVL